MGCRQCTLGIDYETKVAEDAEENVDSELEAHKLRISECVGPSDGRGKYVPPELPNTVQCVEGVDKLDPFVVHELLENGSCTLVDVRGDDRSAGIVEGALHFPAVGEVPFAEKVPELIEKCRNQPLVVFMCQYSCHRAPWCANEYRARTDPNQKVAISLGGFRGWEGNQLPVLRHLPTCDDGKGADAYAFVQGLQVACLASTSPSSSQCPSQCPSWAPSPVLPKQHTWPGSAEIRPPVSQQTWPGSVEIRPPPEGTPSQWTWPNTTTASTPDTTDVGSLCGGTPLGRHPTASKPEPHTLWVGNGEASTGSCSRGGSAVFEAVRASEVCSHASYHPPCTSPPVLAPTLARRVGTSVAHPAGGVCSFTPLSVDTLRVHQQAVHAQPPRPAVSIAAISTAPQYSHAARYV